VSALTDAVRQALGAADMPTAATDVKQLICEELARVDPEADIRRTDYFNHSYVPDVVVQWPAQPVREVFLRFMAPDTVQDDVALIGPTGPVVVDLSTATAPARHEETITAASMVIEAFPRVLLTDTEATEHIRPHQTANFVEHLLVSNLLRAGRGQLTEPVAQAAVVASRAGFDGATALNPEPIRAVVDVARSLLNLDLERRVEKSLQLLWWAAGGTPAEFPVSLPDDMELNKSDTRDFLRMVFTDAQAIDDAGFWARLADRIDFDMLVEAGDVRTSENLNRLMESLAGRLVLSHAVLDPHERPFPPDDQLAWALADHFLQLTGPDWSCRFTPHGNRFSQRRDEGEPVLLSTASDRSDGLFVEEAEIQEAARRVHLTRTAVEPGSHRGTSLSALTQGFPDDARVRSIVVQVGEHRLTAEFDRMMIASTPDAPVLRMANIAIRLLASLTDDEQQELAAFLEG
jgi:hypothetical protein